MDPSSLSSCSSLIHSIRQSIHRVVVGQEEAVTLLLAALLAGGHVLLEDVPGTGKTLLAKTMAAVLELTFSRIQFTPDLLPSDITGIFYYNPKLGEFQMRQGPVFANLILADEINRATPRTQSSLLEAMEERQVTIEGTTCPLPSPFFVIATQNPAETSGTYPLPEAQLDRFFMRLSMRYPSKEEELDILERFQASNPLSQLSPACSLSQLLQLQRAAELVYVHPDLLSYLVDLMQATRNQADLLCGGSPRASLALLRAAKAKALTDSRDYVVPEDIKAVAVPVLAHRLIPVRSLHRQASGEELITKLLCTIPLPTENWRSGL